MKLRLWVALFCIQLIAANPQLSAAQTKPETKDQTIKLSTELIEVRAVVTDKQGNLVDGLVKEDFEVLENNRPQAVSFFSVERVSGKDSRRPAADKNSVAAGDVSPAESASRTIALFVDTLHLSTTSLLSMKQGLRRYVSEQLSDQDLVALIPTTGTLGLVGQFTRDRRILRYAIEKLAPGPSSNDSFFTPYLAAMVDRDDPDALRVATSIIAAEERLQPAAQYVRSRARQILSDAAYQTRSTLLTVKAVAETMSKMPGQRLMVMFSDGFTLWDVGGQISTGEVQSAVSRAVRSGVTIYSIDAGGLRPPSLFDVSRPNAGSDPRIMSYANASERDVQDGMNALARDTGGEPFFNTNDLAGAIQKALDKNRLYYALAYYPSTANDRKPFRQIAVRVKNHPEYKVRSQKGYLASELAKARRDEQALTPEQRLIRAIVAPLSLTALGLVVEADYLESEADQAQVTLKVNLDAERLDYRERDGRYQFALQVATVIFDSAGKRVDGHTETIDGNLLPERLALAKRSGYKYSRRFALKPGLYQIRVGARESSTDRIGTGWALVEVPNLAKQKLALSNILLLDSKRDASDSSAPQGSIGAKVVQGIRFYRKERLLAVLFSNLLRFDKGKPGSGVANADRRFSRRQVDCEGQLAGGFGSKVGKGQQEHRCRRGTQA